MASTVKFDTWQNTAGELIADTAAGARLPLSGNAIINGDFGIWQRGTTSGVVTTATHYVADRFAGQPFGASVTYSQGSFTPADIEAVGYGDAKFYWRATSTGGATGAVRTIHRLEDVRTFAGQTVTFSFWARADATKNLRAEIRQVFGSGGSGTVVLGQTDLALTTSWVRYSITADLDSVSGKTIASDSRIELTWIKTEDESITYDLWGVQLEAGSVATPFRLAGGGSKAAELALCQRYFQKLKFPVTGTVWSSSTTYAMFPFLQQTRVTPSTTFSGSLPSIFTRGGSVTATSSGSAFNPSDRATFNNFGHSALTAGDSAMVTGGGVLLVDAEL